MTKLKGCLWLLVFFTMLTAISPLAYAAEQKISSISVQIDLPDGAKLHPSIEERIRESIGTVAEKVLIGQKVSLVKKTQGQVSQIVKSVFNSVIRGYHILDIKMAVGEKTVLLLKLQPTSLLIEKVTVNLQLYGLDDKIVQIVGREMSEMTRHVEELIVGIPVEAFVWAEDVIEPIVLGLIKRQLPGFTPTIDLSIGPVLVANLGLKPYGEVVENIKLDLDTSSLPRFMIPALEERVEEELKVFYGLPVEFLQAYEERVLNIVEEALRGERWSRHVYLNHKPELTIGRTTHLALDVEWIDYQIDFSGELNLGLHAPGPALHLSLGKRLTPWLTLKLENELTLNRLTGTLSAGVEANLGAGFKTKVAYKIQENSWKADLDWRHDRFGFTLSPVYPGRLQDAKVAVNYYPLPLSKVSLVYEKEQIWISWNQTL